MDISVGRDPQFSWPVSASTPTPRSIPGSQRYLRVLIVLALYGVSVFAIHGLATDFRTHAPSTSSDMGMCHRR